MTDVKTLTYPGISYRNILGYLNALKDFEAKVNKDGVIIYSRGKSSIRVSNSEGKKEGGIFLSDISPEILGNLEKLIGVRT